VTVECCHPVQLRSSSGRWRPCRWRAVHVRRQQRSADRQLAERPSSLQWLHGHRRSAHRVTPTGHRLAACPAVPGEAREHRFREPGARRRADRGQVPPAYRAASLAALRVVPASTGWAGQSSCR
jgi:hypothetical protein